MVGGKAEQTFFGRWIFYSCRFGFQLKLRLGPRAEDFMFVCPGYHDFDMITGYYPWQMGTLAAASLPILNQGRIRLLSGQTFGIREFVSSRGVVIYLGTLPTLGIYLRGSSGLRIGVAVLICLIAQG